MIGSLHRMGSRVRNSPFLVRQEWLWRKVEPLWQRTFEQIFQRQGMPARINGDEFRLTYEFAARYGRADKQAYEPDIYRAFVDRIRPGMTVLDIGAHVGFFALGAAKRVGPLGKSVRVRTCSREREHPRAAYIFQWVQRPGGNRQESRLRYQRRRALLHER